MSASSRKIIMASPVLKAVKYANVSKTFFRGKYVITLVIFFKKIAYASWA